MRVSPRYGEPEPPLADDYEPTLKHFFDERDQALAAKIIVAGDERQWIQSRGGWAKTYINSAFDPTSPTKDWILFMQKFRTHNCKHRHQGGLVIYVIEGQGYTEVDDEVVEWKAGDLLLLPIKENGVEHRHHNKRPGESCRWMAFIYMPYCRELGFYIEHKEDSPDYRAQRPA
jgi:hypothetical protein